MIHQSLPSFGIEGKPPPKLPQHHVKESETTTLRSKFNNFFHLIFHNFHNLNVHIFGHKSHNPCWLVKMFCPNVSIAIKGQVFKTCIQVQYPSHDEEVMWGIHEKLEGLKHIKLWKQCQGPQNVKRNLPNKVWLLKHPKFECKDIPSLRQLHQVVHFLQQWQQNYQSI